MNLSERRIYWRTIGLGLLLTLLVICADEFGALDRLERYLYDFRARNFQVFTPRPTDQIIHLDIDDPSIKEIGSFPWPRARIAEMIDEIKLAGAKVIGMDIIFPEPQEVRYQKQRDGEFTEIQDDQDLADAVKRAGNVLIPVSVELLERGETAAATSRPARLDYFSKPIPATAPPLLRAENELKTVPILLDAIQYSAVVQFLPESDGVVRDVPLFVNYRGRLMPHMALATTCAQLGVPLENIRITSENVTIPIEDAPPIVIPVRTIKSTQFGPVGMFMNIPWFGPSGRGSWLKLFDYPRHAESKQHLPLNAVWEICQNLHLINSASAEVDVALKSLEAVNPSAKLSTFLTHPDDASRWELVDSNLKELAGFAKTLGAFPAGELKPDEALLLGGYRALEQGARAHGLGKLITEQRDSLKQVLNGKCALIGWTATGKTDFYPTSLDPLCPGVAMQGVVFNAIMTRHFWRFAPWWLGALTTLAVGLLTTFIVARFPVYTALFCTIAVVGGYLAINGLALFDYGGIVLAAAGPLVSAISIWFGVTVARFLYEQAERSRITERFSDYVDPVVVNAVVQNPESVRFDGQMKEISVVFTDLDGFTSLTERLRERTVPLLNDYMSLMLPIIRENRGYWDKFIGDGIMFFYNAPLDNAAHAADAVHTALKMQKATEEFSKGLLAKGLPQVAMRAGITTGMMVVGDAGSTDPKHRASSYTVLGDEVNLGARLESANKALGTRVLVSARTAELSASEILLRPIGVLQVAGKTQGVSTFEALCRKDEVTDAHRRLAEISTEIVNRFREGAFSGCITAAQECESQFGVSRFSTMYLNLCREYLLHPPADGFSGTIVLAQK